MSEALELFERSAPMAHLRVTFVAPAECWEVGRVAAALDAALAASDWVVEGRWDHAWAGQGLSAHRVGAGFTAVLHTWPERGRATLDLFAARSVSGDVERWIVEAVGARIAERACSTRGDPDQAAGQSRQMPYSSIR